MLKMGVHPKIVSERLGHASVQVTLDVYSHVLPGLQEQAALAFEEGLVASNVARRAVAWADGTCMEAASAWVGSAEGQSRTADTWIFSPLLYH